LTGFAGDPTSNPPPLPEQAAIARYRNDETGCIWTAVHRAQRESVLRREYLTGLIADVVTGKLDVRKAAAGLPDEDKSTEPPYEEAMADALPMAQEEDPQRLKNPAAAA